MAINRISFGLTDKAARFSRAALFGLAVVVTGSGLCALGTPVRAAPNPATSPARAQYSLAEASAVNLETTPVMARLSFDLTQGLETEAFVLAGPDRVIVDLPQVDFNLGPGAGRPALANLISKQPVGLVTSYRYGLLAPGKSRIVIDLGAPAKIVRSTVDKFGDKYRLVIELAKTDRASFLHAAQTRRTAAVLSPAVPPQGIPAAVIAPPAASAFAAKPVIVIDPGHGGPDNGAMVNGVAEKAVVLDFAQDLAKKLEAAGHFSVVMTRSSDVFIPLSERVRIARAAGAVLMISIHCDTLTEAGDVGGATVYTVSERASDSASAKFAAKENAADASVGADGQADVADVSDILFDLTVRETRAYSHIFARTLVNYWKVAGRLNKNPERAAGFQVLKAPDVPSVLLELGYLSNAKDSAELRSPDWRDKATDRMTAAVTAYFADRRGPEKAAAGITIPDPGLRPSQGLEPQTTVTSAK